MSSWSKTPKKPPGAQQFALPGIGRGSAPTGNDRRRDPQTPATNAGGSGTGGPSRYNELAGPQPPDTIRDVDMDGNWYSPFQPISPFGPPNVRYPRDWDYKTGWNLDYGTERHAFFRQLQAMSRSWGILRTVIETRKDQLIRMPWAFQIKGQPKKKSKYIDELNAFFAKPDGKMRFGTWRRKLLEDLFVIDAATIYKWKSLSGKPLALDVLDGATIKPLVDDAGRRPDFPSPAYQQIIKGLPMVNFDERELLYAPMRPTPQLPVYGYSPVEHIYVEVTVGIKRLLYQSSFWSEGSMPELIISVPETWTPQQTARFQAHFDALLAGNISLKSRVRFVPGGMKPFDIKNANGDALKGDIDEWWARLICFAFSIPPTPFIRQMNRSTAETAQATAEEEGLHPLLAWFKDEIMDPIVQEDFGYDEIEYNQLPDPEVDQSKQEVILSGYVKEGIMARNEARDQLGLDPMAGGDELTVDTPNGPVPLEETIEAGRAQALAVPDEISRQQDLHEAKVDAVKNPPPIQQLPAPQPPVRGGKQPPGQKEPPQRAKKFGVPDPVPAMIEVAETGAAPFRKSEIDEDATVEPLARDNATVRKQQRALEAAVIGIFSSGGPKITRAVINALQESSLPSQPTEEEIAALAAHITDELSLDELIKLANVAQEPLAVVAEQAGDHAAAQLRLQVGDYAGLISQVHRTALDYAQERAAEMVGMSWDSAGFLVENPDAEMAITDTTRAKLSDLVVKALSPGSEPFDLEAAIRNLKDDITGSNLFSKARAALIAQAEIGMAHNRGTFAALMEAEKSGLTILKKWTTAQDSDVCSEICEANEEAGAIPLIQLFPSGDIAPLGHPRCRCALTGVVTTPEPHAAPAALASAE